METPPIYTSTVVIPDVPPGAVEISRYTYPAFYEMGEYDILDTTSIEFAAQQVLDQDGIHQAVEMILPKLREQGHEPLAYQLIQDGTLEVASVPEQVCLFGNADWCFTPPFAGTPMLSAPRYRLWMLSRNPALGYASVADDGPRALGVAAILLIVMALGAALVFGVIFIAISNGQTRLTELQRQLVEFGRSMLPGEQLKDVYREAVDIPIILMGGFMLAIALIAAKSGQKVEQPRFPLTFSGEARVPIARTGSVGGKIEVGR